MITHTGSGHRRGAHGALYWGRAGVKFFTNTQDPLWCLVRVVRAGASLATTHPVIVCVTGWVLARCATLSHIRPVSPLSLLKPYNLTNTTLGEVTRRS